MTILPLLSAIAFDRKKLLSSRWRFALVSGTALEQINVRTTTGITKLDMAAWHAHSGLGVAYEAHRLLRWPRLLLGGRRQVKPAGV